MEVKDHPIFARFYEVLSLLEDRAIRRYRVEMVGPLAGRVLEVGAGNGLNLPHYGPAARVVAMEPEPHMLRRAARRARAMPRPAELVRAVAEELPFPDGAFDAVVASLVLCSVEDPERAVSELRRVLVPGGVVRFFEHVRARDPRLARRQDRWQRPYGYLSGGCHMNRDTVGTLRGAGFAVRFRRLAYGPALAPHVIGEARAAT